MRVLGIDQSFTSTGLVVFEDNLLIYKDIFSSSKKNGDIHQIFERVIEVKNRVIQVCIEHHIDKVNIEGLGFGARGDATRNLAGLQFGIVCDLIEKLNIRPMVIAPTSLKKKATGSGKATKEEMVSSIQLIDGNFHEYLLSIPKTKGRYDLADAYWLAKLYGGNTAGDDDVL